MKSDEYMLLAVTDFFYKRRSKVKNENFLRYKKGLSAKNTHAEYESPISNWSKVLYQVNITVARSKMRFDLKGLFTRIWHMKSDEWISMHS